MFFSEVEVTNLRATFHHFDEAKRGTLSPEALQRAVSAIDKSCGHSRRTSIAMLIQEVLDRAGGQVHFDAFLKIARLIQDYTERDALQRERLAVRSTGFLQHEIDEFRTIFKSADIHSRGVLTYVEVQKMLAFLIPGLEVARASVTQDGLLDDAVSEEDMSMSMSEAAEKEVVECFQDALSNRNQHELRAILLEVGSGCEENIDFPDFLLVVHRLLEKNWQGINDAAAKVATKVANAR